VFLDPVAALLALCVAYGVMRLRGTVVLSTAVAVGAMALVVMVVALGLMARAGQYNNRRRMSALADAGVLFRDILIAIAVATLLSYLTKGFFTGDPGSRLAVGSFLAAFFVLGLVSRVALRQYEQRLFARGRAVRKILVVGTGAAATDFVHFVSKRPWLGIVPAGIVRCPSHSESTSTPCADRLPLNGGDGSPAPVIDFAHSLDGLRRLHALLRSSGAGEVVVALDEADHSLLPQVAELLTLAHVPFKVVPSLFEQTYRTTELLGFSELPVVDVDVDPLDRVARTFKRALDICVATVALIALLPVNLAVIVAIVAESGFPVFYTHQRVGRNGRLFTMYKFRTMVKDADARFKDLQSKNEAGFSEGRIFKMRKDPRVTRVGAVIRKYSIDEFPQFINVLKGEMSVVGPRPPLPREVEKYERDHLRRLRAVPGITGLWQVSGRSDLDFDDMVRLDRYYLDNWSVRLDLQIMLKTFLVIVGHKGAY
jgi:exopolysaccharide biosynthesis polyprenyl glycosylphosphotransferase